jgi:hypothetical protein
VATSRKIRAVKESGRGISRRQFLGAGAALAGSTILAGYGAPNASGVVNEEILLPESVVPGTIDAIVMPDAVHVRNHQGSATIKLSENAEFHRVHTGDHHTADTVNLNDFYVGDEIVAEGQWLDQEFAATALMQGLRLVEGYVASRSGNVLQTANDSVRLEPDTLIKSFGDFVGKPLAEIAVGDYVYGHAWRDPSTNDLVALRISVRREG